MDRHTTGTQTGDIADIIELWVWPPMAGLHSAEARLLAGSSGGSGCATAWHRHALQPKTGAIPCCGRAGRAQGGGEGAALYEEPVAIARGVLRQSCDEGWRAALLRVPCITARCRRLLRMACAAAAVVPVKRVGARTGLWRMEGICTACRMDPVHADHLGAQRRSYAAGGFAEAKGKYRGSIVDSFALVPIGCAEASDPDDEVRAAGVYG